MSIKGIDVASFQHPHGAPINFDEVKAAGFDFVYVKATEGVGYVNPYFLSDVAAARKAGLAVGAYSFLRANVDAVAAANKFHQTVKGVRLDLPLGLDFESLDGESSSVAHQRLDQFRTVLRQEGERTLTYSYANFVKAHIPATCKFCASDPLWLAAYEATEPSAPKPWTAVTLWQKYDKEQVRGIEDATDGDLFVGKNFDVFAGRSKPAPTVPNWYHRLLEFPPSKLRNPGHTAVVHGVHYQEGDDVRAVQRHLKIRVDGLYGPNTADHVKGFQKLHKIQVDGIVGPHTAKLLG